MGSSDDPPPPAALVDRRPMPLALRSTGLSRDPNANDWSIYEDGVQIGRLYADLQASRPEWTYPDLVDG